MGLIAALIIALTKIIDPTGNITIDPTGNKSITTSVAVNATTVIDPTGNKPGN